MKFDIYKDVSDRIIAELNKGVVPWQKPWTAVGGCVSHATGKRYSCINQMLLGMGGGEFATYKQISAEGGRVKKGAKAFRVVFWSLVSHVDHDANNDDVDTNATKVFPVLRWYNVFKIGEQTDGIAAKYTSQKVIHHEHDANACCEAIIENYVSASGVRFETGEFSQACYHPGLDIVTVPAREFFPKIEEFYSTTFHELVHSTGHTSRLNRGSGTVSFGSKAYAREELVAEIGAAALVNLAGIETRNSFTNSAAYIDSWLSAINKDKKLVVIAAGRAEKAVKCILGNNDFSVPVSHELATQSA